MPKTLETLFSQYFSKIGIFFGPFYKLGNKILDFQDQERTQMKKTQTENLLAYIIEM